MNKKIFVVGTAKFYASWIKDAVLVDNIKDADIVLFTGGEDVDPSLYGAERYDSTYSNIKRDMEEKAIFDSMSASQIALGICRGSQFLCVMNGGLLVQDVSNHAIYGTHCITDGKDKKFEITSTHHQMQCPYVLPKSHYDLLYYAYPRRSNWYEGISIGKMTMQYLADHETEVVLYHVPGKPKCLAIQGHPEMMRDDAPVIEEFNTIIDNLLK